MIAKNNSKIRIRFLILLLAFIIIFTGCENKKTVLSNDSNPKNGIETSLRTEKSLICDSETESAADTIEEAESYTVYITEWGRKYHRENCRYLNQSCIPIDINDLDTQKYTPCSLCEPTARH